VDGKTTDLRNQALPWVGHVPRTVFRQVFAVTLGELAGLDGETWARIQDRMIGSMGAADLNSARAVAEALEREAGEIWRPNRRGNQRLRDVQGAIRELRGRRAAAHERDAHIRRLVDEREAVRVELHEVRERRQLDRAEVERAQSLLPVKRMLERIATLRAEGGPTQLLRGLPPDPPGRFAELRDRRRALEEARTTTARDIEEGEATIAQASATASTLLTRREEIVRLVARAAGCAPDRARAVELEGAIADLKARLDVAASRVLKSSWSEVPADVLTGIPVELLSERITNAKDNGPRVSSTDVSRPWGAWLALATGVALFAWGLTTGQVFVTALGAAAAATALTWWLTLGRTRGTDRSTGGGTSGGAAQTQPDRDIATLLDRLPVREEHVARPGEALATGLGRVRELARRRDELTRALEAARGRVLAVDADARELARSLGREYTADAEIISRDLDREIREGERLQDLAARAERDLVRLLRERDEIAQRTATLEVELTGLTERAEALDPDVERGLEEARRRIEAHHRADQLEEELRRGHPNVDEIQAQIRELDLGRQSWSVDDEALARARARIEAHDEQIEGLLTRGEALEGDVARLRDLETVDAVDSEITSLREEEARLVLMRDRKWILARLLREADRRFREEHQPDLIRRAGSYLSHLTAGRYERLIIDETDGEHLFHLVGPMLPAPVPLASPLSTGTLEQAYLSLRLAIVDHLDQGGEKLPLFVDEIFVNWDGARRARGLEVLASIASTRQVFVFTCHPQVAAELQEHGGRVLELD
jgi:uncharacterized protein YhaN